jgi:hypothetical protein
MAEDDPVLRLAGLSGRDGHVTGVADLRPRRGDGTHDRKAGEMDRLTGDDERAAFAALFMTDCRIEADDEDRPT